MCSRRAMAPEVAPVSLTAAAVYQLPTSFTDGGTGLAAAVGNSSVEPAVPSPLYLGAFNSTYENSVNATGDLYVCGNTGGAPTLYQVAIQGWRFRYRDSRGRLFRQARLLRALP